MKNGFFTSESVSEGHPDKMSDQISDAILDAHLAKDPRSRVACETMVSTGFVVLAGEITSSAQVDYAGVVRQVVKEIGYDDSEMGFDFRSCAVLTAIGKQSPDIAMGVDSPDQGAGDQGLMFGYAIRETPQFMPLSIQLSHALVKNLAALRKKKVVPFLRPDSKSQVTVEYRDGQVVRVDSIVLSTQHTPEASQDQIKQLVMDHLIPQSVPSQWIDKRTRVFVNPTGRFVVGGPQGDCGLTGRKIIVDTYGGHGAHGGGAFSGKDPSKVDRSAAYAARHVAKNVVAAGLADRCLIQVAYAIGVADPMNVYVEDYGTAKVDVALIESAVREIWNLKPAAIVERYDLLKPRYSKTAAYGHFGREEAEFTWERTDCVEQLKDVVKTLSQRT